MLRVIHPNRWFIWALVFLLIASFALMFVIKSYLLELEQEVIEQQTLSLPISKTYSSPALGISVRYPFSWQIEVDPLEARVFTLQNPNDFGENITFAVTDPKYESLIRSNLKIAKEEKIMIADVSGTWLEGADINDSATSDVVLFEHSGSLYYIGGQAKNFEGIVKSIRFLTRP